MGELDGRVALVTAGSRGVGRAIVDAFVDEGAAVVLNGRSEAKGREALNELDAGDAVRFVAAKHAVNGVVKSVAREVGTEGVAVNAILPGRIDPASEHLEALSKLGRRNTVDEVARVAVLLASPSITSITGCLFPVDGGTMPY